MATTPTPNPPSYRSPLVQPNLIVAKDWLRWFNQLQISAAAVTNVETALAALQAEVTSIETSVTKLSAAIAAVELAQLQAASALADLTLVVATLQGLVAQHTYLLTTQQAEIDALTAAAGDGGAADLFGDSTFDFTPQIGGLQNLFATLDTPRDWLREIEELRRYVATLDVSRDWLREIEELRRYIAMLDVPSQGGLSGGPFDPLGSAAAAQAASDPLGMALLWSDPPRDWLREIEELRRYVATLDMPLSIGLLNGLYALLAAQNVFTAAINTFRSSTTSSSLAIDSTVAGNVGGLLFYDLGTVMWLILKQADNTFHITDAAHARDLLSTDTSGNLTSGAPQNSFPLVKVTTAGSGTLGNVSGSGSGGILNLCPGTLSTDPRLYLGGSTSGGGAAGFGIIDADTLLLRCSDGSVAYCQATKTGGISALAPINIPVTGTFGNFQTSWSPTVTPSSGMTVSGYSVLTTEYIRIGPLVFFTLLVSLTLGGTLGNSLVFSLPTGIPVVGGQSPCICYIGPGGTNYSPSYALCSGTTPIGISALPAAGANYAASFYGIFMEGFYRAA